MVEELTTISETATDSTASMIVKACKDCNSNPKRQKSVYRDFYREFNRQRVPLGRTLNTRKTCR